MSKWKCEKGKYKKKALVKMQTPFKIGLNLQYGLYGYFWYLKPHQWFFAKKV